MSGDGTSKITLVVDDWVKDVLKGSGEYGELSSNGRKGLAHYAAMLDPESSSGGLSGVDPDKADNALDQWAEHVEKRKARDIAMRERIDSDIEDANAELELIKELRADLHDGESSEGKEENGVQIQYPDFVPEGKREGGNVYVPDPVYRQIVANYTSKNGIHAVKFRELNNLGLGNHADKYGLSNVELAAVLAQLEQEHKRPVFTS